MPGKPRSEDLRGPAIRAVLKDGLSRYEAARRFPVDDASVFPWGAAYEASGRTQPLTSGGDKRSKLKSLATGCSAVAGERRERDASMLSRFFASEGVSFKKIHASEQEWPDVAEAPAE